ncbi:hypothetical protein FHS96_004840 [Sphingomonas zeicaulis]|uniref:malectin domain-containing carbohydrate-binding protein n=1 Tax=Sphingomonas zeicaulis TaxID=1632740 RepID=UPI003D1E20E2
MAAFFVESRAVLSVPIRASLALLLLCLSLSAPAQARTVRENVAIADGWRSAVFDAEADGKLPAAQGFEAVAFDDAAWATVSVPHNWQGYAFARQVVKGARHGSAWYRRHVSIAVPRADERILLMFEGAASYATVWVNGRQVGRHAGGLTSFTLDITDAARAGDNLIAVRTDNPANIRDLPWISGDDLEKNGCCEGSQPFGLFRPVHVVRASSLRVAPFGVFAWGALGQVNIDRADLMVRNEILNDAGRARDFEIVNQIVDPFGKVVSEARIRQRLAAGARGQYDHALPTIARPRLWSPEAPTLYSLRARIMENGRVVDETSTPYGIRTVEIRAAADGSRRFFLNGQPMTLRGIAEYEHNLGGSHAFSPEQVDARIAQVEAAGFNAFRDGHYPHNFRYGDRLAQDGVLWWTQFSAALYFDTPEFRTGFRALMADWVRERRNNPAVFMWGLQNESKLPKAFAEEMVALIRELDPTASKQRLITTCNGGEGSDWNVPQNWSGTYGGDPAKYGEELIKQALVGEYGAWRSLELHSEAPHSDGVLSETRMAALMQQKAHLADEVADRSVGQFHWLLTTHENPGRPMKMDGTQIWDGIRELDHVGPANNKGLMTLWGEPLDVYYMFRARQVPAAEGPMVYIVSHTWPDRWQAPGRKSGIEVYSNCPEVELFNGRYSLGRRARDGEGRFRWDDVEVRTSILSATCIVAGAVRARDTIRLNNLPAETQAPAKAARDVVKVEKGRHYLYRVNAGGPELVDADGNRWLGDRHLVAGAAWGWRSWADAYGELDPQLGSRRKSFDMIEGTATPALFQSYRYGREQLSYSFAVPDGDYRIELYFAEPWYGRAGIDARGWRLFDVAVNGRTVIRDLDLFKEAGFGRAIRKIVTARAEGGKLLLSFPRVAAGQAVISAIAISAARPGEAQRPQGTDLIAAVEGDAAALSYLDNGDAATTDGAVRWTGLSHELLDSDWVRAGGGATVQLRTDARLYLALPQGMATPAGWQESKLKGATGADVRRFVTRRAGAGEWIAVGAGVPLLVRRPLLSPYAPGTFLGGRGRGITDAELPANSVTNGSVQTNVKGYGGQGFIAFGAGASTLGWTIETGVAGRHRIALRYAKSGAAPADARLSIRDASGIAVVTMALRFASGDGWQDVAVETPSMINAGTYKVELDLADGSGLAIDSMQLD